MDSRIEGSLYSIMKLIWHHSCSNNSSPCLKRASRVSWKLKILLICLKDQSSNNLDTTTQGTSYELNSSNPLRNH
uniref:Uncharacterized protein n=1 Tax=Nelumbo nucifera TaxID=4432 RepID=A0A822ZPP5_NELNU|nr:TPA_asm: hypothetical protein HUJ06_003731 [Nelumbo nucifera]